MELAVRLQNGRLHSLDSDELVQLHFEAKSGKLFRGDSLDWLTGLKSETVDLIFADPPYNLKKADWDDFESHEHYVEWSHAWIEQAARVLKKKRDFVCLRFF
jgi:site-specific DNA-methyltransferase (adenine-specific)